MTIENQVKEILADALGLSGIEEVSSTASLMNDLGADSIDFLDIAFHIEKKMGIKIDTNKFNIAGFDIQDTEYVVDFKLTKTGAENLQRAFPDQKEKYQDGVALRTLLSKVTVEDFVSIVKSKIISDYLILQKDKAVSIEKIIDKYLLSQYGYEVFINYFPEFKNDIKPGLTISELGKIYAAENADDVFQRMLKFIKQAQQL